MTQPSCSPRRSRDWDATHAAWRTDLPALVRALGLGLREFHQAVGEEWCPFRFDLAPRAGPRGGAGPRRRHRLGRVPRRARPSDPGGGAGRARGAGARRRGPGRVPRRLLPAQRGAAGLAGDGLRRPRRAGRRRSLVGHRGRGLERRLELRGGARAALLRGLRHRSGPGRGSGSSGCSTTSCPDPWRRSGPGHGQRRRRTSAR